MIICVYMTNSRYNQVEGKELKFAQLLFIILLDLIVKDKFGIKE